VFVVLFVKSDDELGREVKLVLLLATYTVDDGADMGW
jgi:hypothetical protein